MPNKNSSNQGITKKNSNKTEWVGKGEEKGERQREEKARHSQKQKKKLNRFWNEYSVDFWSSPAEGFFGHHWLKGVMLNYLLTLNL